MLTKQIDTYRQDLLALAKKLDQLLTHDQREVMRMEFTDVPGGPMAVSEEVLGSGIQEVENGLIANERKLLDEVKAALARIDGGTFGRCETCLKVIAKSRLNAVPYARQCIGCASVAEKELVSGSAT